MNFFLVLSHLKKKITEEIRQKMCKKYTSV